MEKSPLRPFYKQRHFYIFKLFGTPKFAFEGCQSGSNLIVVCSLAEVYIFSSIHKCDYLTGR